jgi:hypothetical protein
MNMSLLSPHAPYPETATIFWYLILTLSTKILLRMFLWIHKVNEKKNILQTINRRKASFIGHTLRTNCLLKHVTEGKREGRIEMRGRWGCRLKQVLIRLTEREDTGNLWRMQYISLLHHVSSNRTASSLSKRAQRKRRFKQYKINTLSISKVWNHLKTLP